MVKDFIKDIKDKAKKDPKRIVFPEGTERRVLTAVEVLVKEKIAIPILLGEIDEIKKKIKELKLNIPEDSCSFIKPSDNEKFESYCDELVLLRKEKGMDLTKAKKLMSDVNYFGTMMVHLEDADGMVSGSTHSTAETIRPALQIIKTKEKFHKISGLFFMLLDKRLLLFADAAVNIEPDAKDLAEIAMDTVRTAKKFDIEPRVAMLSFSTHGSANHPNVDKVQEATARIKDKMPDLKIDGEMQVDAALVPEIRKRKCPKCKLDGNANVLIFPDLQAANISYKLVERLAKADAVGPIIQGLNKPVNDLSRGCSWEDIVDVTAFTVVEAQR